MKVTKEINSPYEEMDNIYLATSKGISYVIYETPEGNLKIMDISNNGRIAVQPLTHNSIEII